MKRKRIKGIQVIVFVLVFFVAQSGMQVFAIDDNRGEETGSAQEQSVEQQSIENEDKDSQQNTTEGEDLQSDGNEKDAEEEMLQDDGDEDIKEEDSNDKENSQGESANETPKDGEINQLSDDADDVDYPEFYGEATAYGMTISVSAAEGVFPEGSSLSVDGVIGDEKSSTGADKANVVGSYTFDIKVHDAGGNEIQPADDKKVRISFTGDMFANSNLDTHLYHVDEELATDEDGRTVTATTDGFSYYTVEFTYDDKQYVLKGDESVPLAAIMNAVGLDGNVSNVEVSNEEFFSASNESGQWIIYANKAFSTTEWMRLTIDGIVYEITVTDDNYINYNGPRSVSGVTQGNGEDDFMRGLGAVNILIDSDIINVSKESRNKAKPKKLTSYSEFEFFNPTSYDANDSVYLSLNVDTAKNNGRALSTVKQARNYYPGDIVQYTYEDGAYNKNDNNKKYDVVITYSNLSISFSHADSEIEGNELMLGLFAGNMVGIGGSRKEDSNNGTDKEQRYGVIVDVNIKVIDKVTKEAVPGSYYFPMVDLDVVRATTPAYSNMYTDANVKNYNEQVQLKTGSYIGNLFIPGGNYNPSKPADEKDNMPYLSEITNTNNGIAVAAESTYKNIIDPATRDRDYYTGFVTIANNTDGGIKLTYVGASATLDGWNRQGGVDTHFLSGLPPEPKYTEFYSYENSSNLPADVVATLPTRADPYYNGTDVTAADPTSSRVQVGDETWVFEGWKESEQTINGKDVYFVGKWKKLVFTEHYSYSGKLPKKVLKTLPKRHDTYNNGAEVHPADPSAKEVPVKGGKWVFVGWNKSVDTVNEADVSFVGTWTFIKNTVASNGNGKKNGNNTLNKAKKKVVKKAYVSPETGDNSINPILMVHLAFVSLLVIACLRKKKQEH